jgi:hypothetical protein
MNAVLAQRLDKWMTAPALGDKPLLGILVAMLVSAAAAAFAQALYDLFYEKRDTGSRIQRSFLLFGPSVTLLFICIQLSLPLSLGLLGALSIIRFRVPIKEPEEVGFLMVVIASAIACATYSYLLLAILLVLITLILALRAAGSGRWRCAGAQGGLLVVTLADDAYAARGPALDGVLRQHLGRVRLESLTARDGRTNLSYAFRGKPGIAWPEVRRQLAETCSADAVSVLFGP